MTRVVAGDAGSGGFAGEVLSGDTTSQPGFWLAHVRYEVYGGKHSFVADVRDCNGAFGATPSGLETLH